MSKVCTDSNITNIYLHITQSQYFIYMKVPWKRPGLKVGLCGSSVVSRVGWAKDPGGEEWDKEVLARREFLLIRAPGEGRSRPQLPAERRSHLCISKCQRQNTTKNTHGNWERLESSESCCAACEQECACHHLRDKSNQFAKIKKWEHNRNIIFTPAVADQRRRWRCEVDVWPLLARQSKTRLPGVRFKKNDIITEWHFRIWENSPARVNSGDKVEKHAKKRSTREDRTRYTSIAHHKVKPKHQCYQHK